MVLFQRKIIYMGYIPPGTRTETLADVPKLSKLQNKYCLEETQIQSSGRIKISTLIMSRKSTDKPDCVVLYLQGNAGNSLHRIPVFESLLSSTSRVNPIIVAPAPRSYWSSTKRAPTERGILSDYRSALSSTASRWPRIPIVLYGHSLGGAVAICLLASLDDEKHEPRSVVSDKIQGQQNDSEGEDKMKKALRGLVLENPFASIPGMVHAIYPQRWLPYHYLAPLTWDKWDALAAMRVSSSSIETKSDDSEARKVLPRLSRNMLVLISSKDEVVPPSMGRAIFDARPSGRASEAGEDRARLVEIDGALHEDAWRQLQWRKEMGRYLEGVVQPDGRH